jgi:hypothetical protein
MGTLRAGEKKSQMRKEQYRWKMGTAPASQGAWRKNRSWGVGRGNVEIVSDAEVIACHSLPKAQRGTAGAAGARPSAGRLQQDGVEHVAGSAAQHLHVGFETAALPPGWARESACQPVAAASTRGSSGDRTRCRARTISD